MEDGRIIAIKGDDRDIAIKGDDRDIAIKGDDREVLLFDPTFSVQPRPQDSTSGRDSW